MTINLHFKSIYYGLIFFLIISLSYSNVLNDKKQNLSLDSLNTKIINNDLQNQKEDSLEFDFYSWLYFIALNQNKVLSKDILEYLAFTDIEFNPQKSLNCQAYSAALYSAMIKNELLDSDKIYYTDELKKLIPPKITKNYQQMLI